MDQLEQHEHPGLEISLKELKTNGIEDKEPKDDKQVNGASLRMTKMDQGLEPNTMSDLYGQEITEEEADIYLRSMSSRELKALTARNDDWFNIPIEGYVGNVGEENYDYNPEEDMESMYLTAVDCGVLKRSVMTV